MVAQIAVIGFGEAAQAFFSADGWMGAICAYDLKTEYADTRPDKLADYDRNRVTGCKTITEALDGSLEVFSLVTADQTIIAARSAIESMAPGALFFDMNSVAPETKMEAAELIETSGGRYVDVAVMSPVYPARLKSPLLISSPHAKAAVKALKRIGFEKVRVVGSEVGRAATIKMIRSVMVKGMDALTVECFLAAHKADVTSEILSSLGGDWATKANYNLDRMMIHGTRRAAEMVEVAKTLEGLKISNLMTQKAVSHRPTHWLRKWRQY